MTEKKTIRVVHIVSSLGRGGKERQLSIISSRSRNVDNRIICFNRKESEYFNEYTLGNGLDFIESRGFLKRLMATWKLIRQHNPDLLISWGNMESVFAMILSSLSGIRFINFSIRHGIRLSKWSHWSRMLILHLSKQVVANSFAGLRANGLRRGIVLYNGIENLPPEISEIEKNAKRKKLLGDVVGILIISVANFVPYKDHPTVLRVLSRLKNKDYKFHYIMIGDGPRRKELESMVTSLGLKNEVLLTGSIQNVDQYLMISDIMVHSSMGEGCSNAILEGMKHGLPILATNVGGTPEITDSENSMLFDYGDEDALERYLTVLFSDSGKRAEMGKKSQTIVRERFTVEKMIAEYEHIVNMIANGTS